MGDILIAGDLESPVDFSTASNDSMSGYMNYPQLTRLYQGPKEISSGNNSTIASSIVAELGKRLSGSLLLQDSQISVPSYIPPSNGNKDKLLEEFKVILSKPFNAIAEKSLNRCATFPCSGKRQSCPVIMNGVSGRVVHEQNSLNSENSICTQSISPPAPLKLVSAMKGSREKQGIVPKKLSVTWAPDVYDPPVTSASHTITSYHHQRSRNNKKYGKHKHKGKSSRGSNSDKKHHRRYIGHTDFHSSSLFACNRMLFENVNQNTLELDNFAGNGQDSKCGSTFLRTSQTQLRISIAEAT